MAISVAVAVGDAADPLVTSLVEKARALRIGPGKQARVDMGPLVTASHRARVLSYIELGLQEGAQLVVDGRNCRVVGHEQGFYLGPCLFDGVMPAMRIYREEIFGPALVVVRVPDIETATALINHHEYGNGAVIFTGNGKLANWFMRTVQSGMVGINVPIPVPMAFYSFGGWKRSLFGPLHIHGPDGIRFNTRLKTVTARWPEVSGNGSEPLGF